MGHVVLVLLIPPVEGAEIEDDVPGQVWIGEPEPGTWAVLTTGSYVYYLAIGGVHREWDRPNGHRASGQVRHRPACLVGIAGHGRLGGQQLAEDVVRRDGVGRYDTAR